MLVFSVFVFPLFFGRSDEGGITWIFFLIWGWGYDPVSFFVPFFLIWGWGYDPVSFWVPFFLIWGWGYDPVSFWVPFF